MNPKSPPEKVKSPSRTELKVLFEAIYKHVGGEDEFKEILRDFYQRMHQDILIGFFFENKDLNHIADQQANFILNAAGLRERFEGKGPSTAHIALAPILNGHFDRRLRILEETLDAHSIPPALAQAWVQFEESFRQMVVSD